MAATKAAAAARQVNVCFPSLLPLILLAIFFFTDHCCVAGSRLSNALPLHDGNAQTALLRRTTQIEVLQARSGVHAATVNMQLRGRKAKTENATSAVGSSGDSQEANVKTSTESRDVDSFASYADYGAPRRHPPKNN